MVDMKCLPTLFVHLRPSMEIRSLKSRSSFSVLGLACFGSVLAWQMEHFSSKAARTISGRKPCCLNTVLKRSGDGCPRFLLALRRVDCSSLDKILKDQGWSSFLRSACWESDSDEWGTSGACGIVSGESWGLVISDWDLLSGGTPESIGGLAARTVILIRQAGDGRINWRWAKTSQCSHSSSIRIVPEVLSRYTPKR